MVVCMGRVIPVKRSDGEPTKEEVDAVHKTYIEEQIRLFDRNKERLGYKHATLKIV